MNQAKESDVSETSDSEVDTEISSDTKTLLESDDECKALERYDKGDPKFMEQAFTNMRKLDCLLGERFAREISLRKKRKKHLDNVRQTLSESPSVGAFRHTTRYETENTKRFLSATELEHVSLDQQLDEIASEAGTSKSGSAVVPPESEMSCDSFGSLPKRIQSEELDQVEPNWSVVPTLPDWDLPMDFTEREKESQCTNNAEDHHIAPARSKSKLTFNFDASLPQIDHVQRNIERAGHYYTPDEEDRLNGLLKQTIEDPITLEEGQLSTEFSRNPFDLLGIDIETLRDIEESLKLLRRNPESEPSESSLSENNMEPLQFGFYQSAREENEAASRKFFKITQRLQAIDQQEQAMLDRILEGSVDLEPLATRQGIEDALETAREELVHDIAEKEGQPKDMAMVSFVSKNELQLLLGPMPKMSHFEHLIDRKTSKEHIEKWKNWLKNRESAELLMDTDFVHQYDDAPAEQNVDELSSVQELEKSFESLAQDVKKVRTQIDSLIEHTYSSGV